MAAVATPIVIQRTATAYGIESRSLYELRIIVEKDVRTLINQGKASGSLELGDDIGIQAEADYPEPRTLEDLANARRMYLASFLFEDADANLPPVLLSEG